MGGGLFKRAWLFLLPILTLSEDYDRIESLANLTSISSSSGMATEHSWEFTKSLEGWGSAASSEMGGEVYWSSGSLRVGITNNFVHFDSPRLKIDTRDRHVLCIRYKYVGSASSGRVVLKSNGDGDLTDPVTIDHSVADWDNTTSTEKLQDVRFPIEGDGKWHTTYAHFQYKDSNHTLVRLFDDVLNQMRIYPAIYNKRANVVGHAMHIDYLRLLSSPAIERVTGCNGEQYSKSYEFDELEYQVEMETGNLNGFLKHYETKWVRRANAGEYGRNVTYGRSYNCLRGGGERVTLEGRNFGVKGDAVVFVGGKPCVDVVHDERHPQSKLSCTTPPYDNDGVVDKVVEIRNGALEGLRDVVPFFRYAEFPLEVEFVEVSNVAAKAVDLTWSPGGNIWDAMAVTGYVIRWRKKSVDGGAEEGSEWKETVVGNVTTTTVVDLESDSEYEFEVAGANEDQNDDEWVQIDLYGRRALVGEGLIGKPVRVRAHTLAHDFNFPFFNANMTQNFTAVNNNSTLGPTGVWAGEGHYGLIIVGDANVENCNSSVVCCDTFDALVGPEGSCGGAKNSTSCSCTGHPNPSYLNGEIVGRGVPDNLPGGEKMVVNYEIMKPLVPTLRCGPALRLTASDPRLSGAVWYAREQEVAEGFDTKFSFRIANPSIRCNVMDDAHTNCRSRGADGLAFVVQSLSGSSLGRGGGSLGYGGIKNSLAIEFDTFYNHEELELYENHVSVHTRGWREENDPNDMYSLGSTNDIPDLTDSVIHVRVVYDPIFDEHTLQNPAFKIEPYASHFLENGDFKNGGMGDWGIGMGTLKIFVNNLEDPVLIVPLNLETTLDLNHGRAFVGFTSATGENTWQVHDLLDWTFTSSRRDKNVINQVMPVVVGGEGAYQGCEVVEGGDCVHA